MLAFDLVFIDADAGAMRSTCAPPRPRRSYVVLTEAGAAFASGDVETSRALYAQAVTAARSTRVNDLATSLIAEQALGDAVVGDAARARDELQRAIGPAGEAGSETLWTAALASAFLGQTQQAGKLAQAYQDLQPPAPDIVSVQVPMLRAAAPRGNDPGARFRLNSATPHSAPPTRAALRAVKHMAVAYLVGGRGLQDGDGTARQGRRNR
jgi:hypothetical protein